MRLRRVTALKLAVLALAAAALLPAAASAASGVGRITNDAVHDSSPVIGNGVAFWVRDFRSVVRWSGGASFTTVSTSSSGNIRSLTAAAGRAAWATDGGAGAVYFFDGTSARLVHAAASPASVSIGTVRTDGTNVVWQEWTGSNYEIYLWTGSGAPRNISNTAGSSDSPEIDGGRVVWQESQHNVVGSDRVWLWDGSRARELPRADGSGNIHPIARPRISGNWVAWSDDPTDAALDEDVYLHDIAAGTTRNITRDAERSREAWPTDAGVLFSENGALEFWRRGTGAVERVGSVFAGDAFRQVDVDGNDVAWKSGQVFHYDLVSRVRTQVSNNNVNNQTPQVSRGEIVWWGLWDEVDGPRREIFVYTDTSRLPNSPPVAEAGGPYALYEGDSLTLDASGTTDPDDSVGSLTFRWDLDFDGSFTGGNDVTGMRPTLSWSDVLAKVLGGTLSSGSARTVGLHAQDPDGAASTDTTSVVAFARPADGSAPIVPSLGGLVEDDAGTGASLYVPPGAISAPTIFELAEVPEPASPWESFLPDYDLGDGWWRLSDVFRFGPDGIEFLTPARATFPTAARPAPTRPSPPQIRAYHRPSGSNDVFRDILDDLRATWTGLSISFDLPGIFSEYVILAENSPPVPDAGGPYTVTRGSEIVLAGSATEPDADLGDSVASYAWDLDGDGEFDDATGVTPTVAAGLLPAALGDHPVALRATDSRGVSATDTATLTVVNAPPSVAVGPDMTADEAETVTLSATADDPDGGVVASVSVDWGDGATSDSLSASHAYADDGVYTVRVTVTDDGGASASDTLTVTVSNVAPVVDAGADASADEGSPVSVAASFTDVGVKDMHVASIDWGDGTSSDGRSGTHVYADDGVYTVIVTVTDDDDGAGSDTLTITVANVAPTVEAGADQAADEGSPVAIAPEISDPGSADTHTVSVDWGDGTVSAATSHAYADDGVYPVEVTVRDDDGGAASDTLTVTVANVAPTVDAGADRDAIEGGPVALGASIADPGSADTHTVAVDWGDGTTSDSLTASHAYSDDGAFTVKVTATDDEGASDTDTFVVTVANAAPIVAAGGDRTVAEGSPLQLAAGFTDPGTADTHVVSIDWGDGTPASDSLTASHVYADDGAYRVTVTVSDDDDGVGSASATVTVGNVAPTGSAGPALASDEGSVVSVTATFNDAGTLDTHTATIDWGDGSPASAAAVSESPFGPPGSTAGADGTVTAAHVYDDDGLYTVTVSVVDDDDGILSATTTVTVANVPPTVDAGPDTGGDWGVPVSVVGSVSDPSAADTAAGFTARWTFGDGSDAVGLAASHAYSEPGIYEAVLTAADKDGGTGADTARIEIRRRQATLAYTGTAEAAFGFARLSARVADAVDPATARLGGVDVVFSAGGQTFSATTDDAGVAAVSGPVTLPPGTHTIEISLAGDARYVAAVATGTLTVTSSAGRVAAGLRSAARISASFDVSSDGVSVQGRFNVPQVLRATEVTALGISADGTTAWFAGRGGGGESFVAYVEDNGAGRADRFRLWIDGAERTGDGTLQGGNVRITG